MTKPNPPKSMKDKGKELPAHGDIIDLFAKAQLFDDYAAVMTSASLLDAMLRHLISAHLIRMGSDHIEKIFGEPKGFLNTLSNKIQMSYAMGLVGPQTRGMLEIIRSIRNFFAHYSTQASFSDGFIIDECKKLLTPKSMREGVAASSPILTGRNPPKLDYVHTCNFVCIPMYNHIQFRGTENEFRFPVPIEIY